MNRITASLLVTVAAFIVGCDASHHPQPATVAPVTQHAQTAAVDLHNTVCPVSGDKVEGSKLTETYDGKIYHLCCNDCPKDFKKDPTKYADEVAADPAKYGVK